MGGPLPQLNAPSQRPNESIMTGAVVPQGTTMPDPDVVLRVLYDKTQNPWIARLIRQRR